MHKRDKSLPMYFCRLGLEYPVLPTRGYSVDQRLRNPVNSGDYQIITYMGNEKLKLEFEKLTKGQFIVIDGVISGVWARRSQNTVSVTVDLKQKRHTPAFLDD